MISRRCACCGFVVATSAATLRDCQFKLHYNNEDIFFFFAVAAI